MIRSTCLLILLLFSFSNYAQPAQNSYVAANGLLASSKVLEADPLEAELLALTNAKRTEYGLAALAVDSYLGIAARNHAQEMLELNYISHQSPIAEHATLHQRIRLAGSPVQAFGENLGQVAAEQDVASALIEGWMNSPSHRDNILDPEYTHVGFGISRGPDYLRIVQVFAAQELVLAKATLSPYISEVYHLGLTLNLKNDADVVIFYGDRESKPQRLLAGEQRLELEADSNLTDIHIRLAIRNPYDQNSFIIQDEGWLDPIRNLWKVGTTSETEYARIQSVNAAFRRQRHYQIELNFAHNLRPDIGVFLNEDLLSETKIQGRTLSFLLRELKPTRINLAVRKEQVYEMAVGLELSEIDSKPILAPLAAD